MSMNSKEYFRLKKGVNYILEQGQTGESAKNFIRKPQSYLQIGLKQIFLPILIVIITTVSLYYLFEPFIKSSERYISVWNVIFEIYKVMLGAFSVFVVTLFLTNRWQQRAYSFEMIKELNSHEFLEVRNDLSNRMRIAIKKRKDIDNVLSWFPYTDLYLNKILYRKDISSKLEFSKFVKEHALSRMLYFILRLSNYYKFDMLNVKLTRHLFHFFFCHYEVVMLEFANALRVQRTELNSSGILYDERWDLVAADIEEFFKVIGLGGKLNIDHEYVYFPSINSKISMQQSKNS